MVHNLNKFPPQWAPDAIATEQGWKHPVTGELLVSIKLDPEAFGKAPGVLEAEAKAAAEPVAEPVAPVEIAKSPEAEVAPEPSGRGKGKGKGKAAAA